MPKRTNPSPSSSKKRPRKRTRLTFPKRHTTTPKGVDPNIPTSKEWASMHPYGSFVVEDAEGGKYMFKQGCDALILPDHCDPAEAPKIPDHQLWVARIIEIRTRSPADVWVRVKWFWSPKDVSKIVKSFDSRYCSQYELVPSDHEDYVRFDTFIAVVNVELLDETDTDPPYIGPSTFFSRYKFEYSARKIIKFLKAPLCLCGEPYNPDLARDSPSALTMHFCPRSSCSRWYHRRCMLKHNKILISPPPSQEPLSSLTSRESRLLNSVPPRQEGSDGSKTRPTSRRRLRLIMDQHGQLASLPSDLLALASQPLVKPTFRRSTSPCEPPTIHDVAGNIAPVIKARRFIQDAIVGSEEVPDNWRELIGVKEDMDCNIVDGEKCPHVKCANCGDPI